MLIWKKSKNKSARNVLKKAIFVNKLKNRELDRNQLMFNVKLKSPASTQNVKKVLRHFAALIKKNELLLKVALTLSAEISTTKKINYVKQTNNSIDLAWRRVIWKSNAEHSRIKLKQSDYLKMKLNDKDNYNSKSRTECMNVN